MLTKIVAIVIGALLLVVGGMEFSKAKEDPQGRKIYGIFAAIGLVIIVIAVALLIL